MKVLVFDGSQAEDKTGSQIQGILADKLSRPGWNVETVVLRDQKIGNCAGDFFCWTRNPGVCNIRDDNRVIAAKVMNSDLLVYLTPITFGGYSSALKRMVDHQIQNILPFFARIGGEVHHQKRYEKYPKMLVFGWMDAPDGEAEAVFRHLVRRNAINMYAQTSVCGVVTTDQSDELVAAQVDRLLEDVNAGNSSAAPALPQSKSSALYPSPMRRAVLLVGSPKTRKSNSNSLGGYLMEQLAARGMETQTIQIYTSLNSRERMATLLDAVSRADLVALAFPLYVDALPGPVVVALERIAAGQAAKATSQRFIAIANCGFPESAHNATALAICEVFARRAGFAWAGGLALGAGQGLIHGSPLSELGGQALPLQRSIEMAAMALAEGDAIPQAAVELMAKPVIARWLYLLMGNYGWRMQAKQYGVERKLKTRAYA